jgi:hypothetical protein
MATRTSRSAAVPRWVIALGIAILVILLGMAALHLGGLAPMHHTM